jgi:hypothetical protein
MPCNLTRARRRKLSQESFDQSRQILEALVQTRQHNRKNIESIVKVFPEFSLTEALLQVAIGRGQHPYIDRHLANATQATDLAFLDDAQKLGLQFRPDLGDLVEEQRPPVCEFESAFAAAVSAGECPALMAEQLTFHQSLG